MNKQTTVTIDQEAAQKLERLSRANGVTKKDFISQALDYFERYGINPVKHESPAQEMQKLIKRVNQIIAFIRKQEQDFLRPACEAINKTEIDIQQTFPMLLREDSFKRLLTVRYNFYL